LYAVPLGTHCWWSKIRHSKITALTATCMHSRTVF